MKYKDLTEKEINYYVDTVNPIDKAGSYGIQDWIGMIGVEVINGSYTILLVLTSNKANLNKIELNKINKNSFSVSKHARKFFLVCQTFIKN